MKLQKSIQNKRLALLGLAMAFLILPAVTASAQEKIAFQTFRDDDSEIYVMNTDGSDQTRLTFSSGFDTNPEFSPDGSKIAFSTNRDGNFEIYVMNADGTHQKRLTINSGGDGEPAWSPDGSRIAFTSTRDG